MLSDRDLTVTDQFGLRNQGTTLRPPGLAGLPIPTTLLIDPAGVVRWMDMTQDYTRRNPPDLVRDAIAAQHPRSTG